MLRPTQYYAIYRTLYCFSLQRIMRYIAYFHATGYTGLCDILHTFMLQPTKDYAIYRILSCQGYTGLWIYRTLFATNRFPIGPQTCFRLVHEPVSDGFPIGNVLYQCGISVNSGVIILGKTTPPLQTSLSIFLG